MSAEYAEGGFTPDGPKKKVVGVVHAGEWVASQKLVKSPVARPLLEAIEVAQKRNVIGVLPTVESQSVMRLEDYGVRELLPYFNLITYAQHTYYHRSHYA